jgi:hypothetical protein
MPGVAGAVLSTAAPILESLLALHSCAAVVLCSSAPCDSVIHTVTDAAPLLLACACACCCCRHAGGCQLPTKRCPNRSSQAAAELRGAHRGSRDSSDRHEAGRQAASAGATRSGLCVKVSTRTAASLLVHADSRVRFVVTEGCMCSLISSFRRVALCYHNPYSGPMLGQLGRQEQLFLRWGQHHQLSDLTDCASPVVQPNCQLRPVLH